MAISTDFDAKEILAAGKLDTLVAAINASLAALGTSNIGWPLVVGGNIDMDGDNIIDNMQTLWNIINADEYDTLQDAIDAAAGGGCVLIPPDTTIVAKDISITSSLITIMGCGKSSVIQLDSSPSADLIEIASNLNNVQIVNLQLDGASQGAGIKGVVAKQVTGFRMRNVWMQDFTGDFITVTNSGVDGNSSTDVELTNLFLDTGSGSAAHIAVDDVDRMLISNVNSYASADDGISIAAASVNALISNIKINNVLVDTPGAKGISVAGTSAPADTDHTMVQISDCQVISSTGVAFELGSSGSKLKYADIKNCVAYSPGDDAFNIGVDTGSVTGCAAYNMSGDGVVLNDSTSVYVNGCNIPSANAYGIHCGTSDGCVLTNNNVISAGTEGIFKNNILSTVAPLVTVGNPGSLSSTGYTAVADSTGWIISSAGHTIDTFYDTWSHTIPGNTLKDGDMIRVTFWTTSDSAGSYQLMIDGNAADDFANTSFSEAYGVYCVHVDDIDGTNKTWVSMEAGHRIPAGASVHYISSETMSVNWTGDIIVKIQAKYTAGTGVAVTHVFMEIIGGV